MHWVSLHVLFFGYFLSSSCVFSSWCSWKQCGSERRQPFKKKAGGGLGGRAQRLPPRCMGRLCMCCFFSVIFVFFFLCFFFVMFLEALWQWEEATFEKKGWRGVGGRAQRLPPRCFGCLCMCCFFSVIFVFLLCFFLRDVLGSNVAVQEATLKKKGWRGVHWVSLHVLFFFVICLLLVFFLRDVLGSNVAATLKQKNTAGKPRFFCIFLILVYLLRDVWVRGASPQMHRAFSHLLFLSVVFFERCIGRVCICVFLCHLDLRCIGCLCMCCFFLGVMLGIRGYVSVREGKPYKTL